MSGSGLPHCELSSGRGSGEGRSQRARQMLSEWAQFAASIVWSFCQPLSSFPDSAMKASGLLVKRNGSCDAGGDRTWRDTFFDLAPCDAKLLVQWCFPNSLVAFVFILALPICLQWDADITTQLFLLSLCTIIWAGIIIFHWWSTDVLGKGCTVYTSVRKRTSVEYLPHSAWEASSERSTPNDCLPDSVAVSVDQKRPSLSGACVDRGDSDTSVSFRVSHGSSLFARDLVTRQDESCGSAENTLDSGEAVGGETSEIVKESFEGLPLEITRTETPCEVPLLVSCPSVLKTQETLPCVEEGDSQESAGGVAASYACSPAPTRTTDRLDPTCCPPAASDVLVETLSAGVVISVAQEALPCPEGEIGEGGQGSNVFLHGASECGVGGCSAYGGNTSDSCLVSLGTLLQEKDVHAEHFHDSLPDKSLFDSASLCSNDPLGFSHLGVLVSSSDPEHLTCAGRPEEVEASGGMQTTCFLPEVLCDVSNEDPEDPYGAHGKCVESKVFDVPRDMSGSKFSGPHSTAVEHAVRQQMHVTCGDISPAIECSEAEWKDSLASAGVVCDHLLSVQYPRTLLATQPSPQEDASHQQRISLVRPETAGFLLENGVMPAFGSDDILPVSREFSSRDFQRSPEMEPRSLADFHGINNGVESVVKFAKNGRRKALQSASVAQKKRQRKFHGYQGFRQDSRAMLQYYMSVVSECRREGDSERAVQVLEYIKKKGDVVPDAQLLNYVLHVCVSAQNTAWTKRLFEDIEGEGVADIVTYNTILKGYSSAKDLEAAEKLFERMRARNITPDVVTYNLMVNTAVSAGKIEKAWDYVDRMKEANMVPDKCTVSSLIKSVQAGQSQELLQRALELMDSANVCEDSILLSTCIDAISRLGDNTRLSRLLKKYEASSPALKPHAYATIIKAYGRLGKLDKAIEVWDELCSRRETELSDYTYSCMLDCLLTNKLVDQAANLFLTMVERGVADAVHFSTLVKGLAKHGGKGVDKALEAYSRAREVAANYHVSTMNRLLPRHRSRLDVTDSTKQYKEVLNTVSINALLQLCVKNGRMRDALDVFQDMEVMPGVFPDVVSYSTLIKGLCCSPGDAPLKHALDLLRRMLTSHITPDAILFNTLIQGAATRKNVEMVESLLNLMCSANVKPSSYTLCQCVKLYGKCNNLRQALHLVETLPAQFNFDIDGYVYTALITACISNRACGLAARFAVQARKAGIDVQPDVIERLKVALRHSGSRQLGQKDLEEFDRFWNLPRQHGSSSDSFGDTRGRRSGQRRGGNLIIRRAGPLGLT